MKRHYIDISVLVHGLAPAELESRFESLADAVYDLVDVIDPDLGMDLGRSLLEFSMAVDSESSPEALSTALNAARTVLHRIGATTAGWEQYFEIIEEHIRVAPTRSEHSGDDERFVTA
jgi:hypothetical protein